MRHLVSLVAQLSTDELTVETCDVADGDTLRTLQLAGTGIRTVAEA